MANMSFAIRIMLPAMILLPLGCASDQRVADEPALRGIIHEVSDLQASLRMLDNQLAVLSGWSWTLFMVYDLAGADGDATADVSLAIDARAESLRTELAAVRASGSENQQREFVQRASGEVEDMLREMRLLADGVGKAMTVKNP